MWDRVARGRNAGCRGVEQSKPTGWHHGFLRVHTTVNLAVNRHKLSGRLYFLQLFMKRKKTLTGGNSKRKSNSCSLNECCVSTSGRGFRAKFVSNNNEKTQRVAFKKLFIFRQLGIFCCLGGHIEDIQGVAGGGEPVTLRHKGHRKTRWQEAPAQRPAAPNAVAPAGRLCAKASTSVLLLLHACAAGPLAFLS